MNDLMSVVDWSRAQFALTAMYHWLFVPLTLGLGVIVAIMETAYVRTGSEKWLALTKFWMKLFGINFAIGVATGIILEFEFGTNWSNYSWFVGDIFGAPLAIEGLLAFFMEATFIAVMFFGWGKVSKRFHLTATWLTAIGATLSAAWILIANAWMQLPVGMEFDPAQMRNVMDRFWDIVLSPVAIHKFIHSVFSGWALAGVFVISVSCWFMLKKRNRAMALRSIKVGGWTGLVGLLITLWSGDGSAVDVARYQPMKLAAMEALYDGGSGEELVAVGILNPDKALDNDADPFIFKVGIPKMLSVLATHRLDGYVPGINDLIAGRAANHAGDSVATDSYAERIAIGRSAHDALRDYDAARTSANMAAMDSALVRLKAGYPYFGYGYLDTPAQAVPPVAMTFYAFRIMVCAGGYLLLFFVVFLFMAYRKPGAYGSRWTQWIGMLTLIVVYACSQSGWITAEVGRQPWIIQDLMPTRAAVSFISTGMVQLTFWLFALIFTGLLAAEIGIMLRAIDKGSRSDYDSLPDTPVSTAN
ncbi:MAG: cytochrome ubiquinol oxidase subunit I [Candidatus Amulumruptor caecigallinarius]|nr:cytochrome ubiquinol oxidase subunit I [Candidatus Amulumruptor caecigallinarius]MCM1396128.1 cytochrome ubiquinol oxidase subunit I [Candidatus Amulumruptor caecigallinarius]MCM1453872.1 cytochrome ubiquinol oxidase subunit I [bacterium]